MSAYEKVLDKDDADDVLERTSNALASCSDDACASHTLRGTAMGAAFERALALFVDKHWTERAASARAGVDGLRAEMGDWFDGALLALGRDLGVQWPDEPVVVAIVTESAPAGRAALAPSTLASRGSCFVRDKADPATCVLTHAFFRLGAASDLRRMLDRHLDAIAAERAWKLLVIHAVAAATPKRVSPLRASAMVVAPAALSWLEKEWPARVRGEPIESFAARYARAQ